MTGLSPTTTSATSCSFASLVRRTTTWRESGGAPSSTTRLNAPLRSRMSAHQALRSAPCGRITQSRPLAPASAHSRGARVRDPSMTAVHRRASTAVVHQVPDECRPPAAARALDLRQPPAGHAAVRQRAIERLDPGRDRGGIAGARRWQDGRQLLAEGGNGHEWRGGRRQEAGGSEATAVPFA